MKFRNQFLKYQLNCIEGEESGGGGQAGDGSQDTGGEGDPNNSNNNVDDFSTIWDNKPNAAEGQIPQQIQIAPEPQSAEQVFNEHVNSLGFGGSADAIMEAMQSQNSENMLAAVSQMQADTYRATMVDANKIIEQRVAAALAEMQNTTHNTITANSAVAQLEYALPWTKQPAYAPMAKAVMNKFLEQDGATPEKAIEEVGKFFTQFANAAAPNGSQPPSSGPTGGYANQHPGQQQQQNQQPQPKEIDWIAYLGGKPT